MIVQVLRAKVWFPNGHSLEGQVIFSYRPESKPWLVQARFKVANATDTYEIERVALTRAAMFPPMGGQWMTSAGAPIRLGGGTRFVRIRVTDTENETWADFDVNRRKLRKFISKTTDMCDYTSEKQAMEAYIEKSLGGLL